MITDRHQTRPAIRQYGTLHTNRRLTDIRQMTPLSLEVCNKYPTQVGLRRATRR